MLFRSQLTPGNYGQAVILTATSTDIAGLHTVTGTATLEIEKPEPQFSASYTYTKLPFDVGFSAFRSVAPRGIAIGSTRPDAVQETTGISTSMGLAVPK